jgi:predicted 3-demethylubiquinone-9 3-methyltransferase (glyoxalase superfamily)
VKNTNQPLDKTQGKRIVPHLWFDKQAKEAAEFYCSTFPASKITNVTRLYDTPSGKVDSVSFELWGQEFMAIGAGPEFKFNPSISFFVNFDPSRDSGARDHLDATWEKLSKGGTVLMPLDTYPFSEHYGWIQDRYGLSWQLILTNPEGEERPPILPSLMFVGNVCGKAEEAIGFYLSIFKNARQGGLVHYQAGMEPDQEGAVMFADFMLENQWFAAMDSARDHRFNFNEAVSFIVNCDTQEQVDYYWEKLSAIPEAEQCGWLKDKYGVSWQIVPQALSEMMQNGTEEQVVRVTQTFLKMKKLEIASLKKVYDGH